MTIKTKVEKEISVEIDLPAYYKWNTSTYKIISEDSAIEIREGYSSTSIGIACCLRGCIASAIQDGTKITEEEFVTAFERVGEKVKRELIKAIETDQWNAQESEEEETQLSEEEEEQERHGFHMMKLYDSSKGH